MICRIVIFSRIVRISFRFKWRCCRCYFLCTKPRFYIGICTFVVTNIFMSVLISFKPLFLLVLITARLFSAKLILT